jgi:hypothetical protein
MQGREDKVKACKAREGLVLTEQATSLQKEKNQGQMLLSITVHG